MTMVWTKGVHEETDEKEKLRSWWRPIGGGECKETNQGYCRAACRWAGKWRPHSIQDRGPKKGLLRREGHSLKRRLIWFQAYRFYRLSANPAPPGAHPPECEGPALGAWKREGSSSSLVEASQNRSPCRGKKCSRLRDLKSLFHRIDGNLPQIKRGSRCGRTMRTMKICVWMYI